MAICRSTEDRRAIEITQVPDLLLIIGDAIADGSSISTSLPCIQAGPLTDLVPPVNHARTIAPWYWRGYD